MDIADILIEEMRNIYQSGGNEKRYGHWQQLSDKIASKYKQEHDNESLRKAWNYILKTYRKTYDELHSTGAPGYDEFFRSKQKRSKIRYE